MKQELNECTSSWVCQVLVCVCLEPSFTFKLVQIWNIMPLFVSDFFAIELQQMEISFQSLNGCASFHIQFYNNQF